ncbi:glycoside hydrolase family 9 protein [Paenibacillus xylanexedens]|uniref:glycoside hydrolase family 9 protein n=1 Tax=Paenibacillus xylanexedens TaxID=528191 RepID=UPI0011A6C11F|nr:glycoside hydrolase family 9 protein [Paenibacillus xylanexedens]
MTKIKRVSILRKLSIFSLSFVTALMFVSLTSFASAEHSPLVNYLPPGGDNWNTLRDIEIKENAWGSGTTVTNEVYKEQNARKVVTNDYWSDHLVINGWQSFDFSPYQNGTLEFDVAGAEGDEEFRIGFRDVVHERVDGNGEFYKDNDQNPEETNIDGQVQLSEYTSLTTEWQHVSIPLKDIFNSDPLFDESKIQLLKLSGDNTPITFWISNIKVTSPDVEPSYAPIKVNQVGYLSYGNKYANVSGYYNELTADIGTPFQVKRTSDHSIAYSGELSLVAAYDELSGEKVFEANFSDLNEPGKYYITVDGIDKSSTTFEIGMNVYEELLKDVQKFFYFQRANVDLLPEHAGKFARTGLHKVDANLPLQSDPNQLKDVSGGWWDAGDTGKYVTAAATAVSDLLWAYESFPEQFTDGQLNIPESGNNIPDLIDEIKFETDFFLKMQDEQSGGFYSYIVRESAPERYIIDGTGEESIIPTAQTAATIGALAHAYTVFKDIAGMEEYADTLLDSAVRGWTYLEAHPEFIAQPDGPYNDDDDLNDRYYAASALYRATGEEIYNDFVVANYKAFANQFNTTDFSHGIGSMELIGFYHYLSGPAPSQEVKDWFIPKYKDWSRIVIDTAINQAVWHNSTNKGFYWGANSNVAGVAVSLDIGNRIIDNYDERMLQVASGNLNYLLGTNPLQLSFITGHGENRVHTTHHVIYMSDFIKEMPNGYMPGGPNNNGKYNFPAKAYNQATVDWESNEQALNYNSPLIYLTALLNNVDNNTFPESIQLDSTVGTLSVGETTNIMATVTPSNSTFKKLKVTSSDTSIAKVSHVNYKAETGVTEFTVTAVNEGKTVVNVQSFDGRVQANYVIEIVRGSSSSNPDPIPNPNPDTGTGTLPTSTPAKPGSNTSQTINGSGIKTDQNGIVTLTHENLENAARKAVNGKITIGVETLRGLEKVEVHLPGDWIRTVDTSSTKSVSIQSLGTTVEFDSAYLKGLFEKNAKKLSISISVASPETLSTEIHTLLGDSPVYDFSLSLDNTPLQWSDQPVTVKLPYTLKAGFHPNQVVVYTVDEGLQIIKYASFDQKSNTIHFRPEHLSKYSVTFNHVGFTDIGSLPSATSDAVRAIAARAIITGKSPETYDPAGKLTRAEFVQMLVKFFDANDAAAVSQFSDVKKDAWYYTAVASAEKLGIVQGKNSSTFGTNDILTRQEMIVLLHRALLMTDHSLQAIEQELPLFTDQANISEYAQNAVTALKQANILDVSPSGSLDPKLQASRAEAAVLIYNLLLINLK